MPSAATPHIIFTAIAIVATATLVWISAGAEPAIVALIGGLLTAVLASPVTGVDTGGLPANVHQQTQANRAEDAINALPDPLLLIDGTCITAANAAAMQLLGAHIVGEDVRIAIRHPAAADMLKQPDAATSPEPVLLVGLGTRDQHWELRVLPMTVGGHIVHLSDRTASYAADRVRVDFVANASHELRTPLASILGFIEVLGDLDDDPATRGHFLEIMGNEAQRMQRLIDDLMSLSRIEADKSRVPDDEVDLPQLIHQVYGELLVMDPERAADVVLKLNDEAGAPAIRGDHVQLSQLLHNIIGNALKYGQSGTPVEVSLSPAGSSMLRLSVRDHGDGIAPHHLPRLTERFYRADASRSRKIGGTGLGLAIVKHIVERHRGQLDIASTQGEGTEVTVHLPTKA